MKTQIENTVFATSQEHPLRQGGHVPRLQAADDTGLAVLDAGAEGLDLGRARALHGVLEVNVLCHAHLRIEQRRAALVAQLLARVLQAPDDPCTPLCMHKLFG